MPEWIDPPPPDADSLERRVEALERQVAVLQDRRRISWWWIVILLLAAPVLMGKFIGWWAGGF
jgi:hypothetical protein